MSAIPTLSFQRQHPVALTLTTAVALKVPVAVHLVVDFHHHLSDGRPLSMDSFTDGDASRLSCGTGVSGSFSFSILLYSSTS